MALDRRHGGPGRVGTFQRRLREVPVSLSDFWSRTHPEFRQPVPLGAIRCYLVERLYSALTCTNGCSCWSPHEREIALVCRCKRHAPPLRHMPILLVRNSALILAALAAPSIARPSRLQPCTQRQRCTAVRQLPKAATPTRDLPADRPPWHRLQSAAVKSHFVVYLVIVGGYQPS
jgi:hypothetical protein